MNRQNTIKRLAALETREGKKWPPGESAIDEKATAALRWLIKLYRSKRADAVDAVMSAAATKDMSRELRRVFATKVVDLLEAVEPKHREEFFARAREREAVAPADSKVGAQPEGVLLDALAIGIGPIVAR